MITALCATAHRATLASSTLDPRPRILNEYGRLPNHVRPYRRPWFGVDPDTVDYDAGMPRAITLASTSPEYSPDGIPRSALFDDVYHSADGGEAQARHVFLSGNALPARWAARRTFTIVETGFGLGLNFLETWRAFDDDAARPGHLHFVSVEAHPLDADALRRAHAGRSDHAARVGDLLKARGMRRHRRHQQQKLHHQ